MYHSFGDFVDSAVSARGYDQTNTLGGPPPRQPDRGTRTGGRNQSSFVACFGENTSGAFEPVRAPVLQLPRMGIVDDDASVRAESH